MGRRRGRASCAATTLVAALAGLVAAALVAVAAGQRDIAPEARFDPSVNSIGRQPFPACHGIEIVPPWLPLANTSLCRVDNPAGSPAVFWHGFWSGPGTITLPVAPPPLYFRTGDPWPGFVPFETPTAAAVLDLADAYLVGLTGHAYTADAAYTLTDGVDPAAPRSDFGVVDGVPVGHLPRHAPTHGPSVRVAVLNGTVLSLVQIYQDLFQHFLFDGLPRLDLAWDLLRLSPRTRILHPGGVAAMFLQHLGFPADRLVAAERHVVYRAERLWLPVFAHRPFMGCVPAGSFARVQPLLLAGPPPPPAERTRLVFLPRPAGHGRALAPAVEASLLATLRRALRPPYVLDDGWQSKKDAKHNWLEDRKRFADAIVVFGPHGGAFSNIAFSPSGLNVIEFLPMQKLRRAGANPRPCYHYMAHGLGHKYWMIEPTAPMVHSDQFFYEPGMVIDVSQVLAILVRLGIANDIPVVGPPKSPK